MNDDVSGYIEIFKNTTSFEYLSINIQLIGHIENYLEPKNSINFITLSNDISKNGSLNKEKTIFHFNFKNVKLQYESYKGDILSLKYFIRVNIEKKMWTYTFEEEFAVVRPNEGEILKLNDEPISMNLGINDLLTVLVELNHINYSIQGTLKGAVTFGKVNLLLTKVEIQLIKKETLYGPNAKKNFKNKIITSYELIDGGPYKNETIPFRFFLSPYNLTPTYVDVAGYFSVRYFLNLVIKDQNNNRYFKQKEIFLYRLYLNKEQKNKYNNNEIEHLKDFITEPIDYGDYFSSFDVNEDDKNDNDEDTKKNEKLEQTDFYFKSNLTGFINDISHKQNEIENEKNNDDEINIDKENKKIISRSNTTLNIRIRNNFIDINDDDNINNNKYNNIRDDNDIIKKSYLLKKNKKNKVINIKEKNKYKTNDILINDNYYSTDNYIIYENSYNNAFNNKLKATRIKSSIQDNKNDNNKDKNIIDNNNIMSFGENASLINNINDGNLFFPDEPFSNNLIMENFPTKYANIGENKDFRKTLMGKRIKQGNNII